jgi:hypothetical protein
VDHLHSSSGVDRNAAVRSQLPYRAPRGIL